MADHSEKLENYFTAKNLIAVPNILRIITIISLVTILLVVGILALVPWQQSTFGSGKVIAIEPNDRIQDINATISGRIHHWFVKDGDRVKKGDPLVEIRDIDPQFVERLQKEVDSKRKKVEATEMAAETAIRDQDRQKQLFERGLSSRKSYEYATIQYKKLLAELALAQADLAKSEIMLSREGGRIVRAVADGEILGVDAAAGGTMVKEGDHLARFLPIASRLAVEVYVSGQDLPLVRPERDVRIQFEGFPAILFSGWPSLSMGTFEGKVLSVDTSSEKNGRFRVLLEPKYKESWQSRFELRQGTRANAWIMLDVVKLGFELWRQFNGFPLTATSSNFKNPSSDKK